MQACQGPKHPVRTPGRCPGKSLVKDSKLCVPADPFYYNTIMLRKISNALLNMIILLCHTGKNFSRKRIWPIWNDQLNLLGSIAVITLLYSRLLYISINRYFLQQQIHILTTRLQQDLSIPVKGLRVISEHFVQSLQSPDIITGDKLIITTAAISLLICRNS
jgi:hypothetical protein